MSRSRSSRWRATAALGQRSGPAAARTRARGRAPRPPSPRAARSSVAACCAKSAWCRLALGAQAVAPRPRARAPPRPGSRQRLAAPLGREHRERRRRPRPRAPPAPAPGSARPACGATIWISPCSGASQPPIRALRVYSPKPKSPMHPRHQQRREAGVDRVRQLRHQQHGAEPAVLLLGHRLGAEERGRCARRAGRSRRRDRRVGPCSGLGHVVLLDLEADLDQLLHPPHRQHLADPRIEEVLEQRRPLRGEVERRLVDDRLRRPPAPARRAASPSGSRRARG